MKNRSVIIYAGGGGSPEPATEWHPRLNPSEKLTKEVLVPSDWTTKKSILSLRGVSVANDVAISLGTRYWSTGLLRHCVPRNDCRAVACLAFTMAEILLSLTIIGVVAAITLPSLTGNINERTWNTQRKALYARFSQAVALMPALNGYGTLTEGDSSTSAEDTAAETFVTAGLSKVLKINNICDSEHLADCGIPDKITNMSGGTIASFPRTMSALNSMMVSISYSNSWNSGSYSQLDTKAAAFETANGESLAVYYNPNCISDMASTDSEDPMQPKICANFVYDLNGTKGPNTVGKDIGFITVLYPTDSVVAAPMPHIAEGKRGLSLSEGAQYCTSLDSEYRVPNKDEAAALFVNKDLIGNLPQGWLSTSTKGLTSTGSMAAWAQSTYTGNRVLRSLSNATTENYVRCVKR